MNPAPPRLYDLFAEAQLVELGRPLVTGMPTSPNHPGFRMALLRRHGDMTRPDGSSAANEIIITGGHVGTHIDALSHASHEGLLFGGIDAAEAQCTGRFTTHGAETIPPMFTRGIFFDVAAAQGVDRLPGGYGVGPAELSAIADGIGPRPGDVAIIRTGWGTLWDDPDAYVGHASGVPGVSPDGARWLIDRGFQAVGADTTAFEQILPGKGHSIMPVHRMLLVESGIHIIEHMDLEALHLAGVVEFTFLMAPLAIVGGTGSPIRPFAAVER